MNNAEMTVLREMAAVINRLASEVEELRKAIKYASENNNKVTRRTAKRNKK